MRWLLRRQDLRSTSLAYPSRGRHSAPSPTLLRCAAPLCASSATAISCTRQTSRSTKSTTTEARMNTGRGSCTSCSRPAAVPSRARRSGSWSRISHTSSSSPGQAPRATRSLAHRRYHVVRQPVLCASRRTSLSTVTSWRSSVHLRRRPNAPSPPTLCRTRPRPPTTRIPQNALPRPRAVLLMLVL